MTFILAGSGVYNPPRQFIGAYSYNGQFVEMTPKMHIVKELDAPKYEVVTYCSRRLKYLIRRLRNVDRVPIKQQCKNCIREVARQE